MTKISTLITGGAIAVLGMATIPAGMSVLANDSGGDDGNLANCVVTGTTATIVSGGTATPGDPCELIGPDSIDTAEYFGPIESLIDYMFTYNSVNGHAYGAGWFDNATLNFTVNGGEISTEGIGVLYANLPAGITNVEITLPSTGLTVTDIAWIQPAEINIDFTDQVVNLPAATSPADALDYYNSLADDLVIVGVGSSFAISTEEFEGSQTAVIHLPEGTTEAEAMAIALSITNGDVLIAVNNNDDFSISVEAGQEPVVNRKTVDTSNVDTTGGSSDELTAPATGRR